MVRVRISEIAEHAGVSTATVSRVLNNIGQVAPATTEKVKSSIKQLSYHPNVAAQALVTGGSLPQSRCIRIFSRGCRSDADFFGEIEKSVLHELAENDCSVKVSYSGPWGREFGQEQAYDDCLAYAGVLLLGNAWPNVIKRCHEADVPVVTVCDRAYGTPVDEFEQDNRDGVTRVVQHLLALGHRNIGYVGLTEDKPAWAERYEGFCKSVKKGGGIFLPEAMVECQPDIDTACQAFLANFGIGRNLPATAFFCANDETALGVLKACRIADIAVPEKLSVAGFDDQASSLNSEPPLTTVGTDRVVMGREIAKRLIARIDHPEIPPMKFILPTQLIIRSSTGPAYAG